MPQTGYTPIQIYSSSTPTNAPSAGNLTNDTKGSELAINIADKNLFFKDSTNAVNTVPIRQSGAASDGWLSSTDWNTFNNKQPAGAYLTSVTADSPLSGAGTSASHLIIAQATTSTSGYLSSTDWNTFNNKQAALVSGTNIKTVSGTTLLGSGDLGTIGTGYGGTGLTSFTSGGVVYASSTSALATGSTLYFNGTNLGIGTTSPAAKIHASSTQPQLILQDPSTAATGVGGVMKFLGYTSGTGGANYFAEIKGVKNNGTAGGELQFFTSTTAGSSTEKVRIWPAGGVSIGNTTDPGATNLSVTGTGKFGTTVGVGAATPAASGAGITFPATQSDSSDANTLDDYEEGTWTPTITGASGSITTYSARVATYTKIGNICTVQAYIAISNIGTISGALTLNGLPFTSNITSNAYQEGHGRANGLNALTAPANGLIGYQVGNNATIATIQVGTATGVSAMDAAALKNGCDFIVSITYRTA